MGSIVVIGASAGGFGPVVQILAALPETCALTIFVVMHIGNRPSALPTVLGRAGRLPASFAEDGAAIESGRIYVAPPDQHLLVDRGRIRLSRGPKVHRTRPAADPLFVSAAAAYGDRVIGIVLSGADSDGAAGLRTIKQHGGVVLVQRPADALVPSMPLAAIAADHPDACLPLEDIARRVAAFCSDRRHAPPLQVTGAA
jgi:two-component system, chemotaxis family, protein-glutamate methylesterase/glutaminase